MNSGKCLCFQTSVRKRRFHHCHAGGLSGARDHVRLIWKKRTEPDTELLDRAQAVYSQPKQFEQIVLEDNERFPQKAERSRAPHMWYSGP